MDLGGEIFTTIKDIGNKSYLELGTGPERYKNKTYNKIHAKKKMGVDTNGTAPYHGTTDEYFADYPEEMYDIVFIDACHDRDFVIRDFNNSVKIANEWIVLHDMIPPEEKYTGSEWCGDSYKILYYIMTQTNFTFYTMDENYGLTFVKMPAKEITLNEESLNLPYTKYVSFMGNKKLYSNEEMTEILNNEK